MNAPTAVSMKQVPRLPLLVDDYFADFPKVGEFFNGDFREIEAFRRQAGRVRQRHIPREDLAAVLREQNEGYGCGPQTLGQIEKIVRDQACAVVTGQQVGLFSGPLYAIYKALTAVKLSEYLSRNCPGSFVPIFWLASDDHDLAEIDHIALIDQGNQLEEIRCPMPSLEPGIPASNLMLPQEINDAIRQLKDFTMDSEFKAEIIGHLSEAYRPGRSFVEAFARWLTRLFRSRGLILIDASHPRLKALGSDLYVQEIAGESPSTREAVATSRRLRQAGYDVQVPLHEGTLNIFFTETERRSVQWDGGAFAIKGMEPKIKKEALVALAREKPFLFSPNVLLRPIYQDILLPTVAYIGGPGEIAYFAQMKGIYESFHLPMPVIYPRKSVTILEKKIDHILKKYSLVIPDIWRDADGLFGKITREQIPVSLQNCLSLVRGHVEQDMASLKKEILAIEPTLGDSVDLAKGRMNQQLEYLEKKSLQAAKKRNETANQQLRKAVLNLYPRQHLQERVFNIVPYLIKYGYACMDELDKAVDIEEYGHQILSVG